MAYEKRVCVLKQIKRGFSADGGTLTGAVYAERMGRELVITPRIPGIAPLREGRYAVALWVEGEVKIFELSLSAPVRLQDAPSIKGGFSVLLVFLKGEIEPVAYGSCGIAPSNYEQLLSAVKESKSCKKKEKEREPFRGTAYDDDAIADADYYQRPPHADDEGGSPLGGENAAEADGKKPHSDEDAGLFRPRGTLTYYNTVRERLKKAFETLPRDTRLVSVFPCSEWVKTDGALLGMIFREGVPAYLCVATEADGDTPPAGMEHACFVPASPFSDGSGFWITFQSADSGEYVTVQSD